MALGGDIINKDGTGSVSIYGPFFKVWVNFNPYNRQSHLGLSMMREGYCQCMQQMVK